MYVVLLNWYKIISETLYVSSQLYLFITVFLLRFILFQILIKTREYYNVFALYQSNEAKQLLFTFIFLHKRVCDWSN